jgi:outer membrane protein OmpA-like peptidoglycan-associated protein
VEGDLAAGFGILDRLELALALPIETIVAAEGSDVVADVGDLRLRVKARLVGGRAGEPGLALGVLAEFGFPTGGDTLYAGAGGFSATFAALASFALAQGPIFAATLGVRGRGTEHIEGLAIGSELRWGLGVDVPLVKQLALMGEVEGAIGLVAPDQFPIEARLGARIHMGGGVSLALAGGAGVTHGYGAPDWRLVAGLTWVAGATPPIVTLAPAELTAAERHRKRARPQPDPNHADPNAKDPTAPDGPPPDGPRPEAPRPEAPTIDTTAFDAAADLDPDPDQDGVLGELDSCPVEREDIDGFDDVDGCPDPDNDDDGILDNADKCVEVAETINGVDDHDGCPDGAASPTLDLSSPDLAQAIVFESGSDVLQAASDAPLKQMAAILRAAGPKTRVRIEGHTDGWGDPEFNVDLSERRAIRVRMYLIALGVPPERMIAKGFGATHPIAKNASQTGRQKNRRVVFAPLYEDARTPRPEVTP